MTLHAHATKFLSVKEVATVMHVSVATVWRYAQRGTLPPPIRIDGHTWWIKAEVLAVIEEKMASRQQPTPKHLQTPTTSEKRLRVRLLEAAVAKQARSIKA